MQNIDVRIDQSASQAALRGEPEQAFFTDTEVKIFNPLLHLEEFEGRFPKELALFRAVGIHPQVLANIINPYTLKPATESFSNIGEHCLAVGYCASKIAQALCSAGLIDEAARDWVTSRALVHDLTKPYEIMRRSAKELGDVYSVTAYDKLRPLLIDIGVAEEMAEYLMVAGRETGHNSLKDFIVCGPNGFDRLVPGKLAEKVVHLADDMTFTSTPKGYDKPITAFLTCWERMLASQFLEKYPFLWTEGLGRSEDGALKPIKDLSLEQAGVKVVGTYAELQVRVANAIARQIQLLLEPSNKLPPENFVRTLLNA